MKKSEAVVGELTASVTPKEPMLPSIPPSEKKLKTNELGMKATAGLKELLLLDPP